MFVLIAFAFLAGLVTILSPCILPVLPIILSSSATGSKRHPWGVVLGFLLSFTFFTLFLTTIVRLTGISADALRTFSVIVVFGFGLVLLFPQLLKMFEVVASKVANIQIGGGVSEERGFLSGIVIGVSLGLVWTPCVGPILASVITLALTGSVNGSAVLITFAYAFGTAIPMLAILYGGRGLIQKVPSLLNNLSKIQKVFGVLMILTALAINFNYDRKFQTYILEKFPNYGAGLTNFENTDLIRKQLDSMGDKKEAFEFAPELIEGGKWFNSEPLKLADLKGKVVLVDFWTYSCINCIRTFPYLEKWHEKYAKDGLVIIGVHTPEFEFEKDPDNLQKAIDDFGLKYPIMQDNNYATWRAYNNRYWPAKYFIDAEGRVVANHFGEGDYDESEKMIRKLLKEAGSSFVDEIVQNDDYSVDASTPETYLGSARMAGFSSPEGLHADELFTYSYPDSLEASSFAFAGQWIVQDEKAMPKKGASLKFDFEAKNVFLVMNPLGGDGEVEVSLDGEVLKNIIIDSDKLYQLVELQKAGRHILELKFLDNNSEVYAFTFG
ncbi:hypothetical protein COU74_04395 [Candidatus Peregrinibacteria bacterium CG10_big_fil_rev_8_21_14_0_10_36_19]|nr:MAG: hypothetical protein COU74_04395 [Candidatus Peregrinibacteria bacterium CG10_big_fil_rev_8_21_14_0_10_36_19]